MFFDGLVGVSQWHECGEMITSFFVCYLCALSLSTLFVSVHISSPPFQLWDVGKGFRIPEVYRSGYAVLLLSLLTSAALAAL